MTNESLLIEFATNGVGNGNTTAALRQVSADAIQANISKLAHWVQQLAQVNSGQGLELDEVSIAVKINENGEVILLGDGQGSGALTLHFRRSNGATVAADQSGGKSGVTATTATVTANKLANLLAVGQWEQANLETWDQLCQAAQKPPRSQLTAEDLQRIPAQVFQEIDRLWQAHSQGKYGFSAQKQIYTATSNR
ncbi:MAG: GUN4 domain-containing protein [Pseudanabaena sp. ELA607]|jgi:hypothetical protein